MGTGFIGWLEPASLNKYNATAFRILRAHRFFLRTSVGGYGSGSCFIATRHLVLAVHLLYFHTEIPQGGLQEAQSQAKSTISSRITDRELAST
jgi:hypothetical protein